MRDYLETFFRRKWLFWLPFVAVLAVATAGGLYSAWLYEVQARVEIRPSSQTPQAGGTDLATEYGRLSDLLLTDGFLQRIVNAVPPLKANATSAPTMQAQVDKMRKDLNAWKPGQNLINFRYQNRDPQIAQQVVSKTIDLFIAQRYDDRVTAAQKEIDFWTGQRVVFNGRLETASKALTDWETAHPPVDRAKLPESEQLNFQRLKAGYDAALTNVQTADSKMGEAEMNKALALNVQANTYNIVDAPRVPDSIALSLNKLLGLVGVGLLVALGLGFSLVALATWFGGGRRGNTSPSSTALPAWLDRLMREEQQPA